MATEAQPDRRKMSPADKKFRRGLYVMLMALGMLAAGGLIYAKDAISAAHDARDQAVKTANLQSDRNAELTRQLALLLDLQEKMASDSADRSAKAQKERQELLQRIQRLEVFIAEVLRNSSDPAVRNAARGVLTPAPEPTPTPRPPNSPGPTSMPRPTPSVTPTPTGSPSPGPTCVTTPNVVLCVNLGELASQPWFRA